MFVILVLCLSCPGVYAQWEVEAAEASTNLTKWLALKSGRKAKEKQNDKTVERMSFVEGAYQLVKTIKDSHLIDKLVRNARTLAKGEEVIVEAKKCVELALDIAEDLEANLDDAEMLIAQTFAIADFTEEQVSELYALLTKERGLTDREIYTLLESYATEFRKLSITLTRIRGQVSQLDLVQEGIKQDLNQFKQLLD